jgi:TetR/AcrR family transcriptional regulator
MFMGNREQILETAIILFSRQGYDGVGITEITESCGITKPTLYHYFGSKRGLLEAIYQERYSPFVQRFADCAAYAGDLRQNLEACMALYLDGAREDPDLFRFLLSSGFAPPDSEVQASVQPYSKNVSHSLESLFQAAVKDHGNMRGRHSAYSAGFLGTTHAYVSLFLSGDIKLDKKAQERVVHYFMHGIFS